MRRGSCVDFCSSSRSFLAMPHARNIPQPSSLVFASIIERYMRATRLRLRVSCRVALGRECALSGHLLMDN